MNRMKCTSFCMMLALCAVLAHGARAAEPAYPFLDTSLSIDARVADLVGRLTLEEKVSLMNEEAAAVPRLGIREYKYWNEALHGVARSGKFTVFPQAIAMGATWDPDLIHTMATAISDEAWGAINRDAPDSGFPPKRFLTFWSPTINMARDPRWGRTPETYGEDPFLTAQIALGFVRGLQGDDPRYVKTVATPKHFVANNEDATRAWCNATVSEKNLREYYFPAFKATVMQGHALSVMGAYNAVNGVPCNANKWLLTDVLRNEWGFDGFVVTDCGALSWMISHHQYAKDGAASAAFAANAGVDIECGGERIMSKNLMQAVAQGLVSEQTIDEAVTRLMRIRMRLGMFDPYEMNPYSKIAPSVIGKQEHMMLARRISQESIVLLKNENFDGAPLLPIDKKQVKSLAVVGSHGDYLEFGDYTGEPANPPVTLIQGIREKAGADVAVKFVPWISVESAAYELVPEQALKSPDGAPGAAVAFFGDPDFQGAAAHTRVDKNIVLLKKYMPEGFGKGPCAVRWTGSITPAYTGIHVFRVQARGKVNLSIAGRTLAFEEQQEKEKDKFKTGQVLRENELKPPEQELHLLLAFMEKGADYSLSLDYVPAGPNPLLKLEWDKPDPRTVAAREAEYGAVRTSHMVIASMGYRKEHEHEGMDRGDMGLPPGQSEYVQALLGLNPKTVVVLTNGSPLAINWIAGHAPAILEWWIPGEQGGAAMADVLFGDYNPAGRLPFTVYKSISDLPPFGDYDITKGRTYMYFQGEPLYPFGYGLSYTAFDYYDLDVQQKGQGADAAIDVSFGVVNAGPRDGEEVAQVYARRINAPADRPLKKLHGFKRVRVEKERDAYVAVTFPVSDLAAWDAQQKQFVVVPGEYEIMVGGSSADIALRKTITIK